MTATFIDLGVRAELSAGLAKGGITEPTAIQIAAIPVVLEKKNAYLQAQTGTGKTLAYLLPLYSMLDPDIANVQVIIVAPTHELAIQIQRQCTELSQQSGLPVRVLLLIGGTPVNRQLEKLKKKPHIIVGSCGRIADLIDARKLKTHMVKTIVVDEADRLLTPEHLPALQVIIKSTLRERRLIFVSATNQPEANALIESLCPATVKINTALGPVNPEIDHLYLLCEEREKTELVRKLIHALKPERTIVFVHKNEAAELLCSKLAHHKLNVVDLHGELDKEERKRAMDRVRSGKADVLVASDVAARGLDIKGVTHVINYDVPTLSGAYLHRAGRTGRAGAPGVAVSLIGERQSHVIARFRKELGIKLTEVFLRDGALHEAKS